MCWYFGCSSEWTVEAVHAHIIAVYKDIREITSCLCVQARAINFILRVK